LPSSSRTAGEHEDLVRTTGQLARRDLVEIDAGPDLWVSVERNAVSFTVPRLGSYLRGSQLIA
jgi:hypothetical protein